MLLYGCESWTLRSRHVCALNKAWLGMVRAACGISWVAQRDDRIGSAELLRLANLPSLHTMLYRRVAGWVGHVARRVPGTSLTYCTLFGCLPNRVCPASTERNYAKGHFTSTARLVIQHIPEVDERVWARSAQHRASWARSVGRIDVPPPSRRQGATRAFPRAARRGPFLTLEPSACIKGELMECKLFACGSMFFADSFAYCTTL